MTPLRILRVISHLDVGGVQRQMLLVFRELRELGVECEAAVQHRRGRLAGKFEEEGFPLHELHFKSRLDPLGMLRLRLLCARRKIDVVHAHMYASNVAVNAAFRFARRPVVVNGYHNQILIKSDRQAARVRKQRNRPAAYVAVGQSVKDALCELGPDPAKVHVIVNGVVGPETPAPLPERKPDEPLRMLWAGRFVNQKRLEFFPELAAACREAGLPVEITLFGDGPAMRRIAEDVKRLDVGDLVKLPGVTSDVFGELATRHLYVSASYREGLPNALLEALAAGRPALVSDIAPHAEVVEGSGCGLLAPMETEAWVERLRSLIEDHGELQRMAAAALKAGSRYTVANAARQTLKLYESLLS